jgi:hypothetical protein
MFVAKIAKARYLVAADDAPHLIEQFWFVRGRHSHYPLRHDSDFALPNLKLKPD